jgi:hypothetical protein
MARLLVEEALVYALEAELPRSQVQWIFDTASELGLATGPAAQTETETPVEIENPRQAFILALAGGVESLEPYLAAPGPGPELLGWLWTEAVRTRRLACVERLLETGAISKAQLDAGFELAAGRAGPSWPEGLALLGERGADRSHVDELLLAAARWGSAEGIAALVEQGADPNADPAPLLVAIEALDHRAVAGLLAAGADPRRPAPSGRSPLEIAEELHAHYRHSYTYQLERALVQALEQLDPAPQAASPKATRSEAPPEPGPGPDEAPDMPGFEHLGSFECPGLLRFAGASRIAQTFDAERFVAATLDLLAPNAERRVEAVEIARIPVQAGRWDVYASSRRRPRQLVVQHRNSGEQPPGHLRYIGGLELANELAPTVCVVPEASEATRSPDAPGGRGPSVSARGCVVTLDDDEAYEWVASTGHRGGRGLIRKLLIQAGIGE